MNSAGTIDVSFNLVEEMYVALYTSPDNTLRETYLRLQDNSIELTLLEPLGARGIVKPEYILHQPIKELFEGKELEDVIKRYPQYTIRIKPICFV